MQQKTRKMNNEARGQHTVHDTRLAEKLDEKRNLAEQFGEVYTNLPKERFADASFDDRPTSPEIPQLKREGFDLGGSSRPEPSASPRFSAVSFPTMFFSPHAKVAADLKKSFSSKAVSTQSPAPRMALPMPLTELLGCCRKCLSPQDALRELYPSDLYMSILKQTCSECGDSLMPIGHEPVSVPMAHVCDACGWRSCLRCELSHGLNQRIEEARAVVAADMEEQYSSKLRLLQHENDTLKGELSSKSPPRSPSGAIIPPPSPSMLNSDLINSLKERITELEQKLSSEKASRSQVASLLSSLQKEHIQYKTEVEMNLESGAAEQVLLQSRLIEQSVLLADARARIDELSSTQRRSPDDSLSTSSGISQREAIMINENNHLKEEIDSLKLSIHHEFDHWKKSVMRQVRNECIRYRDRLKKSLQLVSDRDQDELDAPAVDDTLNEKDLDYLFDEVDWTGDVNTFTKGTPERESGREAII